jgi:hypothetical protein
METSKGRRLQRLCAQRLCNVVVCLPCWGVQGCVLPVERTAAAGAPSWVALPCSSCVLLGRAGRGVRGAPCCLPRWSTSTEKREFTSKYNWRGRVAGAPRCSRHTLRPPLAVNSYKCMDLCAGVLCCAPAACCSAAVLPTAALDQNARPAVLRLPKVQVAWGCRQSTLWRG